MPVPEPTTPSAAGAATVELAVTGMHCASCAALIEETLAERSGVAGAAVDLDAGRARVAFDPTAVTVEELCAAVADAGYGASPGGEPSPGS
jgi:Cu+-exporting ATPase